MTDRVYVYDTTLRDGAQMEGVSFSVADKLAVFHELVRFGVDFIETGMPAANPKDEEFNRVVSETHPKVAVAFGSTRRINAKAAEDPGLKILAESGDTVCIFGKSWDYHVRDALGTTLEENLEMVSDSVAYLVSQGKSVVFDAEHFFDGWKANPGYALSVLKAAADAGASWLVLCDTNGGSMPSEVRKATEDVLAHCPGVPVGIHSHNDSELGVACSLAAVESGATMVQGTINGIGERCGNANLCSIIPALVLKMGKSLPNVNMSMLTGVSRFVSESANIRHQAHMPYVGDKAFAHKGGMHISAVLKAPDTYEHVAPDRVGNRRRLLVSDMAGRATIMEKMRGMGLDPDMETVTEVTNRVKEMEAAGYQFEGADASFRLIVDRMTPGYERPFEIAGFRLHMDEASSSGIKSEASIKVRDRSGNEEHTASDGNGPVNALDNALRKALTKFYPQLADVRLTDYKVRVLDEKAATAAAVRVLITSTDGKGIWTTVGVSDNVIEASLIALSDSIEYALAPRSGE
ncbi:MAG: citramalate synthase [Thermoplasmatales archaeon]|nr:citramalate synthase [Thermoplasmatales archaeon]